MRPMLSHTHHWLVIAERTGLRMLTVVTGILLIVVSLLLDVTIMLLPAGVALGLTGSGLILWGITDDLLDE